MNFCERHGLNVLDGRCQLCGEDIRIKKPFGIGLTGSQPEVAMKTGEEMKTTAPQLLNKALIIQEQRASQYDKPGGERSMGKVVGMFNLAKGREVLTEADGWLIQALLKIVRSEANGPHSDSVEDLVSYSSLYGEARLAEVS